MQKVSTITFKNKDTSLWNVAPRSGLKKSLQQVDGVSGVFRILWRGDRAKDARFDASEAPMGCPLPTEEGVWGGGCAPPQHFF